MTLDAPQDCRNVIGRLESGGLDTAARCMAGLAFFWRPFEDALDVTTFAGKLHMGTGERETRFKVVEIHRVFCLSRNRIAVE